MKMTKEEKNQLKADREQKRNGLLKLIPDQEREIADRSKRIEDIGKHVEEAKRLALANGKSVTLIKLVDAKSKEFKAHLDRLRLENPDAHIPPTSTINRQRLAYICGLVKLNKIPSAKTSSLWGHVDEIKAAGDDVIGEMLKQYGTINNLLNCKRGAATPSQADIDAKEDRALAAQIGRLKSTITRRTRLVDVAKRAAIFGCYELSTKVGTPEPTPASGGVPTGQEALAQAA
jgi:hypothetical protein